MFTVLEKLYEGLRSLGEALAAPLATVMSVGSAINPIDAPDSDEGSYFVDMDPTADVEFYDTTPPE